MKYVWIGRHKKQWPITLQCEVLDVSASGYFEHQRRKGPDQPAKHGKRIGDEALLIHIKAAHAGARGEYGWPRIWKELRANGVRVGKERIQRLMKQRGIKARGKRKYVVTTDSKHNLPIAPNLLNRDLQPAQPNAVWASDITYIQTDEGWLYLAAVIDLIQPSGSGLEHATSHAGQLGGRRVAHGVVQEKTGAGADIPFGSG